MGNKCYNKPHLRGITMEDEVKLFMIFDILGDTIRTGPTLWHIKRERLEDVKNHILDLLLIARILEKHLPSFLDQKKIFDYIICHDLPEAITGDITKFEGISDEERDRVTKIAIDYLCERFNGVMDLRGILDAYEGKVDIEAKVVNMIDKVHSSTTFLKYVSEQEVDMNDHILPTLRNHPFVVEKYNEGYDLGDIFYMFHIRSVNISDEECLRYGISKEDAESITSAIKSFAQEFYEQKLSKRLLISKDELPKEALKYNRKYN